MQLIMLEITIDFVQSVNVIFVVYFSSSIRSKLFEAGKLMNYIVNFHKKLFTFIIT